jgi:hypothetical protein
MGEISENKANYIKIRSVDFRHRRRTRPLLFSKRVTIKQPMLGYDVVPR